MISNQKGFTLIEILVALVIVALAFTAFVGSPFTSNERSKLSDSIARVQRIIKLAQDESILQNKITRIRFTRDEDNEEEVLMEIGVASSSEILLLESIDTSKLDRKEFEAYEEKLKEQNASFTPIEDDIDQKDLKIIDPISFLGIGLPEKKELIQNEIDIFFFPSGEKDMAVIYLMNQKEIAQIQIDSFQVHTDYTFITSIFDPEENPNKNSFDFQLERAQKIFKRWREKF